jgi:hypothetical protein
MEKWTSLVRQEESVRSVLMGENTWTHEGSI